MSQDESQAACQAQVDDLTKLCQDLTTSNEKLRKGKERLAHFVKRYKAELLSAVGGEAYLHVVEQIEQIENKKSKDES